MNKRMSRVNSLILEQLGQIFREELELPEGTLVTISFVDTQPNLRNTRIAVSIFPFEKKMQVLDLLNRRKGELQKSLAKNISLKYTPVLHFILDPTEENAYKMDAVLDEVLREKGSFI